MAYSDEDEVNVPEDLGNLSGNESDEDLGSAWEQALTESNDSESLGDLAVDKILSQNEIDSLLGIAQDSLGQIQSGIQQILNSELVRYERLPMLEVVFDRFVRLLTTSLRNFTSEGVEITLESMTSVRFGDYLNSVPLPAMINIFKVKEWDDLGLITIDSALIYSIVDVLLGGRKGNALMRIEGRPYTTIEQKLVERLVGVLLNDLKLSFDPLCNVHFNSERMETNPIFAAISRPANAVIVSKIRIDMEEHGGKFEILFPYSTLEPIRDLLLQTFMGEKFGQDSIWEKHLETHLWEAELTLEAVLDELYLPLSQVLNLKPGDQIKLNADPQSKALIKCGDKTLFTGTMGRKSDNLAIKIEEEFLKNTGDFQ